MCIPSPTLTVGHSSKGFGLAPLVKGKNKLDTITEQELIRNVNKGYKLIILIFIIFIQ
jgi:hypothetical protein